MPPWRTSWAMSPGRSSLERPLWPRPPPPGRLQSTGSRGKSRKAATTTGSSTPTSTRQRRSNPLRGCGPASRHSRLPTQQRAHAPCTRLAARVCVRLPASPIPISSTRQAFLRLAGASLSSSLRPPISHTRLPRLMSQLLRSRSGAVAAHAANTNRVSASSGLRACTHCGPRLRAKSIGMPKAAMGCSCPLMSN